MDNILTRVRGMYIGRINQQQFIIWAIIMFVIETLAVTIGSQIAITLGVIGVGINGLIMFIVTILTMHLYVRRLHDVDVSGWLALVIILLTGIHIMLGLICFLILAIVPSVLYTNQYGEVPRKDRSLLSIFMNT